MSHYKFIELGDNKFLIEKDAVVFWDVTFRVGWGNLWGFETSDCYNNHFVLKGRSIFNRKLNLYKNGELLAKFIKERCIYPYEKIWLDGRKFVYDQEAYICSLDPKRDDADRRKIIYEWKIEDDAKYGWVVASIALISIQGRAHVTGVRY